MRHRFGETVTWHQVVEGETNEYGDPVGAAEIDHEVPGVAVAKTSVAEPRDDGSYRLVEETTLYFDPPLTVSRRDLFTVRGERYEVEGGSALDEWRNPFTGAVPGSEIKVRRVTG